jgi:hypothetical protein
MTCCLCGFEDVRVKEQTSGPPRLLEVTCNRCADYVVPEDTMNTLSMVRKREGTAHRRFPDLVGKLHLVPGYNREMRLLGIGPIQLTEDGAVGIVRAAPFEAMDRLDRFLLNLGRISAHVGQELEIRAAWDQPLGYCANLEELVAFVRHLAEAELARCDHRQFAVAKEGPLTLTVKGWERVRELRRRPSALRGAVCFVAAGPDPAGKALFDEAIAPALQEAGYVPVRVDRAEDPGRVDDEVLVRMHGSRLVVADVTGHPREVYFQGAYALGRGLPVIWTCSEADSAALRLELPRQELVTWSDAAQLRERLSLRILSLLGEGPHRERREPGAG